MRTLLYPPTVRWDWMRQRPHHLLTRAARSGYRVVWVEPQPQPGVPAVREVEENLVVVNDGARLSSVLTGAVGAYISSPVSLAQMPGLRQTAQTLVFDYMDNCPHWEPHVASALSVADVVLASSRQLWERARQLRPDALLIPNGVEFSAFSEPAPEPFDLALIPHPVALYAGAIDDWIDAVLLLQLAKQLPELSIVVVGPHIGSALLQQFPWPPNLFCLGHRPYRELPGYLHAASVLLLPFVQSTTTEAVNPCTLWEYLAVGKPVVSTPLREVLPLSGLDGALTVAPTQRGFIEAVLRAVRDGRESPLGRAVALNNDWDRRWVQIQGKLEEVWKL